MDPTIVPTHVRKTSQLVHIVAAATATQIFILSATATARMLKIMLMNNTGANDVVTFGTNVGGVWAQTMPGIYILTPFSETWNEWEIPAYEFSSNIFAQSANAGALVPMDILIEVDEIR